MSKKVLPVYVPEERVGLGSRVMDSGQLESLRLTQLGDNVTIHLPELQQRLLDPPPDAGRRFSLAALKKNNPRTSIILNERYD